MRAASKSDLQPLKSTPGRAVNITGKSHNGPSSSALLGKLVEAMKYSRIVSAVVLAPNFSSDCAGGKIVAASYPEGFGDQLSTYEGQSVSEGNGSEPAPLIQWVDLSEVQLSNQGWVARMRDRGFKSFIYVSFPIVGTLGFECLMFSLGGAFDREQSGLVGWTLLAAWPRIRAAIAAERGVLTPKEIECLKRAFDGLTAAQTAERLNCAVRTVRLHLSNAMAKLDAPNSLAAVQRAQLLGIF